MSKNLPPLRKQNLSKKEQDKDDKLKESTDYQSELELLEVPDTLDQD